MMTTDAYIAVDFGGGSGRVIAGHIADDGALHLDEVHRFGNRQVRLGRHLYWDFPALFADMLEGIGKAVAKGYRIRSIGVDTWGVDFGLIDEAGALLSLPICYRDEATAGLPEKFFASHPADGHYSRAGIQTMEINTLFRLMAMQDEQPHLLQCASKLLMMPDLFNYFLTGRAVSEYTEASTTELLDARKREWNFPLIKALGLPERIFPEIVFPGSIIGCITEDVRRQTGIDYDVPVVAAGSHDTAGAAYASLSGTDKSCVTAFLSSGTWSLLGVAIPEPVLTEEARRYGFSNEGGVNGTLLLQNITGLWILQKLMEEWRKSDKNLGYPAIIDEARESTYQGIIDVDSAEFTNPQSMTEAISVHCKEKGMAAPVNRGDYARCVMQSLAARYARGIRELNTLLPAPVQRLNIIGGGSMNTLLNELTSAECGIEVVAGPAEATAIGNIRLQMETINHNS